MLAHPTQQSPDRPAERSSPAFWPRNQREAASTEASELMHALLAAIVEASLDAVIGVSLDGAIFTWNQAAEQICGYTAEEVTGRSVSILIPSDRAGEFHDLGECLLGGDCAGSHETVWLHKDGRRLDIALTISPIKGAAGALIGAALIARDITERNAVERQLAHQAFHDPLTGLPNRALFLDRLEHALAQATRRQTHLAVLFFDLDRFKIINDSLGHEAGDQLLTAVATRLRHCLRSADTIARLGGDEFAILLEQLDDTGEAIRVAQRVIAELQTPFAVCGQEVFVGASIGIGFNSGVQPTSADLLRDADTAMYRAKQAGKGRYEVFDQSMHAASLERLKMETDLRRALKRGEFTMYYQPTVDLATCRIAGLEALVRWIHPRRGLVPPASFIPLAEETGLILPLGRWLLGEACRQVHYWQQRYPLDPPLTLSVNLSARQFLQPDLVDDVARILAATGLDPATLKLEITETTLIAEALFTSGTLQGLKELGVQLVIDDFGTGYSSLGYLKHLPVDMLKIDKTFVAGLGRDPGDTAIVEAMIVLARALGLAVTAEGIERAEQLTHLQALGCQLGQGYYFATPMAGGAAEALLARGRTPLVAPAQVTPVPSSSTAELRRRRSEWAKRVILPTMTRTDANYKKAVR